MRWRVRGKGRGRKRGSGDFEGGLIGIYWGVERCAGLYCMYMYGSCGGKESGRMIVGHRH